MSAERVERRASTDQLVTELLSLGLRLKPGSPCISYVFIKPHNAKAAGSEDDTCVFVGGLPLVMGSEAAVGQVFAAFGGVSQVVLHPSKVTRLTNVLHTASSPGPGRRLRRRAAL